MGLAIALSSPLFGCDKPGATEQQGPDKATQQSNSNAGNAQGTADKEMAGARTEFEKARDDYRRERDTDLSSIDRKISDLDTQARTAAGKVKADLDARMPSIHQERDALVRNMQSIDRTTGATWDSAKAKLDKEWNDLRSSVDNAL